MSDTIRIGIVGYGNLGRGAELAVDKNDDITLVGIFTRRPPDQLKPVFATTPVYSQDSLGDFKDQIDVLVLCGGSKDDLPVQTPKLAAMFNTVDSYDTHARIPEYFDSVDSPASDNQHTAIICNGWDPGMFSINRMLGESLLPSGTTYSFWGKGLSQGHSDAVRRVDGVRAGVQYTIPSEPAMKAVRNGEHPELTTREKHVRACYVVLEDGADADAVEQAIVTMPHYFEPYDTTVHFIDEATLRRDHAKMSHGGFVIHTANTTDDHQHVIEYSLQLESNPEFTASVLITYARACHRLSQTGDFGAKTPFDVAPGLLSPKSAHELRKQLL